jgi:hypothetical protein
MKQPTKPHVCFCNKININLIIRFGQDHLVPGGKPSPTCPHASLSYTSHNIKPPTKPCVYFGKKTDTDLKIWLALGHPISEFMARNWWSDRNMKTYVSTMHQSFWWIERCSPNLYNPIIVRGGNTQLANIQTWIRDAWFRETAWCTSSFVL